MISCVLSTYDVDDDDDDYDNIDDERKHCVYIPGKILKSIFNWKQNESIQI